MDSRQCAHSGRAYRRDSVLFVAVRHAGNVDIHTFRGSRRRCDGCCPPFVLGRMLYGAFGLLEIFGLVLGAPGRAGVLRRRLHLRRLRGSLVLRACRVVVRGFRLCARMRFLVGVHPVRRVHLPVFQDRRQALHCRHFRCKRSHVHGHSVRRPRYELRIRDHLPSDRDRCLHRRHGSVAHR